MISLQEVVHVIMYLLVAAAVFGLLYWLINAVATIFPGEASQALIKVARLVLVVLAVLILLGLLLSYANGTPLFRA